MAYAGICWSVQERSQSPGLVLLCIHPTWKRSIKCFNRQAAGSRLINRRVVFLHRYGGYLNLASGASSLSPTTWAPMGYQILALQHPHEFHPNPPSCSLGPCHVPLSILAERGWPFFFSLCLHNYQKYVNAQALARGLLHRRTRALGKSTMILHLRPAPDPYGYSLG